MNFPLKETDLFAHFLSEDKVRVNQDPTDLWHESPNDQDKECLLVCFTPSEPLANDR